MKNNSGRFSYQPKTTAARRLRAVLFVAGILILLEIAYVLSK